jgi:hypothetical protein
MITKEERRRKAVTAGIATKQLMAERDELRKRRKEAAENLKYWERRKFIATTAEQRVGAGALVAAWSGTLQRIERELAVVEKALI